MATEKIINIEVKVNEKEAKKSIQGVTHEVENLDNAVKNVNENTQKFDKKT